MLKSSMYHYPLITMLYKCSYMYNTLQPLRTRRGAEQCVRCKMTLWLIPEVVNL